MPWNHRVVKETSKNGIDYYSIREVYYDANGVPNGYTEEMMYPYGETVSELEQEVDLFKDAFSKPILVINIEDETLKEENEI